MLLALICHMTLISHHIFAQSRFEKREQDVDTGGAAHYTTDVFINASALYVRRAPHTQSEIDDALVCGQMVKATGQVQGSTWWQIQWACKNRFVHSDHTAQRSEQLTCHPQKPKQYLPADAWLAQVQSNRSIVYEAPRVTSRALATVCEGEWLVVYGVTLDEQWYQVRWQNKTAFISTQAVKLIQPVPQATSQ